MNDQYQISPEQLKEDVIEVLKTIYDPEIPVNIYELGLIYNIEISTSGNVHIDMTLTAPKAHVELVWEPQWTKDMMSEAAQLQLGMF